MTTIKFLVPGLPVGKKAPNVLRRPNFKYPVAITPAATVNYEALVKMSAKAAMGNLPPYALGVPLSLRLEITLPVPGSWSDRKRTRALSGQIRPTSKPDCTNVLKSIEDGMAQVVFANDSAIVEQVIAKRYGANPGVLVEVYPLALGAAA